MKRRALLAYLRNHGCMLLREGGSHSWWAHSVSGKRSAVPRHAEINNYLARKICRDLGVPEPPQFQ
jgi:mRNA interferase HicA